MAGSTQNYSSIGFLNEIIDLANDGMTPVQFFGQLRDSTQSTPEKRLLVACLSEAISLTMGGSRSGSPPRQVMARRDAQEWIARTGHGTHAFAFDDVCAYLDIDPEWLRLGLAAAKDRGFNARRPPASQERQRRMGSR